jgi:predicted thioesterase
VSIPIGAKATATYTVTTDDSATALGSGDVPVLATPRLLAWCEAVTVTALAPALDDGATSVGFQIRLDHLKPTPIGGSVQIEAEIAEVDGRQVTFDVRVTDGGDTVAGGSIVRVVVDRARFVDRLG